MNECEHGDDPNLCPPCQRGGAPYKPPKQTFGARITARYDGYCPECKGDILKGELIELTDAGWRHAEC